MNVKIEHEIIIKADKDVEELLGTLERFFSEVMMKKTLLLCAFLCWAGKQQCNGIDSG